MQKLTALIAIILALVLCSPFAEAQSATAFKKAVQPPAPVKIAPPPKPYVPPPTIKQAVTKAPAPKPAAPVGQNLNNLPKKPTPVKVEPPKKPAPLQIEPPKKTVQDSLRVERAARNEPAIKPAIPKAAPATKSGQPAANMSEAFKARASVSRLKRINSTKLTGKAKSELGAAIHKSEQVATTAAGNAKRGKAKTTKRSNSSKQVGLSISHQKQNGHVKGTLEHKRRLAANKATSTFTDRETADRLTKETWEKGIPVKGNTNRRDYDFGKPIGEGPNGGTQSRVRAHMDDKGRLHGHPVGPVNPNG